MVAKLLLFLTSIFIKYATLVGHETCCPEKQVGSDRYILISETDTSIYNCISNCIYFKTSAPGSRYCFKPSQVLSQASHCIQQGNQTSQCLQGPKLPCPWKNWNCEGDIIKTLYNMTSWEDCGRACDTYHLDGCEYWTYTYTYYSPVIDPVCNLQSSCPGKISDDSISGPWDCIPQTTVQAESSRGTPCAFCPWLCYGACIGGMFCLPTYTCLPFAKTGASLEEACLYQASSLITNECSGNCSVVGEPACQTCISDTVAETCATTKSFGCFSCVYDVVQALYYCLKQGGSPEQILTCIKERIPDSCASCACELACKLHHPICQLC